MTDEKAARAERLKERIYVTFTALAVMLALRTHAESAGAATITLAVAVLGTVLAVFTADVVSHIAVHTALPVRTELRHMAQTSFGALAVLVVPAVFLALAIVGVWSIDLALQVSIYTMIFTLVVIGYIAVRRVRLSAWHRLVVLFAEFTLGLAVVGLEVLAHH